MKERAREGKADGESRTAQIGCCASNTAKNPRTSRAWQRSRHSASAPYAARCVGLSRMPRASTRSPRQLGGTQVADLDAPAEGWIAGWLRSVIE
jgi:hypothetical protein